MSIYLIVRSVDNRLVFNLNGESIFDHTFEHDPPLYFRVPFGHKLVSGRNTMFVHGWNDPNHPNPPGNPWHFAYELHFPGSVIRVDERGNGNQTGWVFSKTHHINTFLEVRDEADQLIAQTAVE